MEEYKNELKARKKAYRRVKRKANLGWRLLTFICLFLAIVLIPVHIIVSTFDNTIAVYLGGTFWELVNEDANAIYYELDYASMAEKKDYGIWLCQQVEAEGAALLLNENNALPLAAGASVSCFSNSSVNLVYGGTGSANIDASEADTLRSALEKAGFSVNGTLWDFYSTGAGSKYARPAGGLIPVDSVVTEVPWDVYTDEVKDSVSSYGDAAIVVLSRVGGEGADLIFQEYNYLALDQNERDLLANLSAMKEAGTLDKIIVLLNTANALQVDFLKDNEYNVDACLWIGDVGISGINAVAEILAGTVNPSGSLVDTYCYDNYSSPAMVNFVPTTYGGYKEGLIPSHASSYMVYQEGIYVGYKYYETRYEDFVMGTGNAGEYVYSDDVAYPFGFGLSYTQFTYSGLSVQYNAVADQYEVSVTVTNTGDTYSGKKTVQVYFQSPYTDYDIRNGVEKSAVALCGFGKTRILAPGESETVKVLVNKRDLASYDAYGAGTYILDQGDYYLTVATDAHNAVNNILTAKGYGSNGRMDGDGDTALVYQWNQPSLDAETYSTSANGTPIVNRLSIADLNLYEGRGDNSVTYLSRSDWEGTWPKSIVQIALTDQMIANLQDIQYDPANYEAVSMPTLGAKNGLKLYDMMGLEYDDPQWETLLDQMEFDEMVALIGDSFHWRMPVKSVEAPGTRDENGPQGLTASLLASSSTQIEATAFTSEDVMAATFNTDLIYEVGKVIGNDCLAADVVCLYGPGNNIHRTPYAGRNFEYYSEDGFLSGMISAYECMAIQEKGVDVVMKHFALNDCEQDRIGLGVWVNEQAAREIYLKAFQAPFEIGNANGVMTAYTRWGTIWSGGNKGLMTHIMREEWGSNGMSITDNVLTSYVNGMDGILAGVSTFDAMMPFIINQLPEYKNDPIIVTAMREACHHNLYALANSSGMNGVGAGTTVKVTGPGLVPQTRVLAIAVTILFVIFLVLWIRGTRRAKQSEEYRSYKEWKDQAKSAR